MSASKEVITREYTIHLHKHVHGRSFKTRAPQAIKAVRRFAQKAMGTTDVRIDPAFNQHLWSHGVRNVQRRIRVRLARRLNEDEDAQEKFYTVVTPVIVESFKGIFFLFACCM
jgi:large subunit ribosomal protein L31e